VKPIHQWPQSRKIIAAFIVIFILTGTPLFVYLYARMQEVKEAFRAYSDQLVAQQYHKAYELAGPDFKMAISEADFTAQQVMLCSRYGDLRKVDTSLSEIEGNDFGWLATLHSHFEYARVNERFEVEMRRYDGQWRLYGYKQR
jgi:hypothetical protein